MAKASIHSRPFGKLPSGEGVEAWLLSGRGGLTLECLTFGGIVTRLLVPDREGQVADVVLGFDNLESYLTGSAYFGAIVGRVAGRIPGAQYCLNGVTYRLAANQATNHLHGGHQGFDKRIWKSAVNRRPDGAPSLRLSLTSPHLDQGHPGNLEITVTYTITDDNCFLIETEASTDRPTPVSLTHHSYFNLAGESNGTIHDHELQILSDDCVAVDNLMTPLAVVKGLDTNGNDFRSIKSLGQAIPHLFSRHGDLYRLRLSTAPEAGSMAPAARLMHRASGRLLDVATSSRWLQLYTGSELEEPNPGKSGFRYGPHAGVCLECQGYPDGVSHPGLGSIVLHPGETGRETTCYAFSNLGDGTPPPASLRIHKTTSLGGSK